MAFVQSIGIGEQSSVKCDIHVFGILGSLHWQTYGTSYEPSLPELVAEIH